jgi:2-dehydro-3-deoxyphosphogluconate aldolase/(4S)-4-hydroxy-2-oxoglutarate aldolase
MPTHRAAVLERMEESGVVAVMRGMDADAAIAAVEALREGGVTAVEFTADTADATRMIREVSGSFAADEAVVGAGTVLDAATASAAIRAGAEFVVSPSLDAGVVETANRYAAPVAPGVMTPTEAVAAYEAGADLVKLFPAATVGPEHLEALRGPLPHVDVMPTGGVGVDNAADFIEAGALCVGAGSALVDDEAVAAGEFDVLTENAAAFSEVIADARGE